PGSFYSSERPADAVTFLLACPACASLYRARPGVARFPGAARDRSRRPASSPRPGHDRRKFPAGCEGPPGNQIGKRRGPAGIGGFPWRSFRRWSRMIQQLSDDLLWSQLVARAWCDQGFMERLRSNPRAVLAENGLEVPADTEVQVVEGKEAGVVDDTDTVRHFILPDCPPEELTDEELVGGAVGWYCGACGRCYPCGCRC